MALMAQFQRLFLAGLAKQLVNFVLVILKDWFMIILTQSFIENIFLSRKDVPVFLEDFEFNTIFFSKAF